MKISELISGHSWNCWCCSRIHVPAGSSQEAERREMNEGPGVPSRPAVCSVLNRQQSVGVACDEDDSLCLRSWELKCSNSTVSSHLQQAGNFQMQDLDLDSMVFGISMWRVPLPSPCSFCPSPAVMLPTVSASQGCALALMPCCVSPPGKPGCLHRWGLACALHRYLWLPQPWAYRGQVSDKDSERTQSMFYS